MNPVRTGIQGTIETDPVVEHGPAYRRTTGGTRPPIGLHRLFSRRLTRRGFLELSGLAVSGVAIGYACGSRKDDPVAMTARGAPTSPTPQPQSELPQMLRLSWSKAPDMPQGMQDNDGGVIGDWLILAGGFCGGGDNDWKPGKYPRGFLRKTWGLDLTAEAQGWIRLPDFPGSARQEMQGISVDDTIYLWGGFSYTPPYAYRDGYRLYREGEEWVWDRLPDLPWPLTTGGICAVGTKIYVLGGADYDGQAFYTTVDRRRGMERLGARLIVFDASRPDEGWRELAQCPGTPRHSPGMAAVGGLVYAIGGDVFAREPSGTHSVVDSWRYDPEGDSWERLRDLPVSCGGFSSGNIVYEDRYLLLATGYQRPTILNPDGTARRKYGTPSRVVETWETHPNFKTSKYFNHFWVYDTETNLYGTATKLPYNDHLPGTHVIDETVYLFAGETGGFEWEGEYYGHHPEFVLKGAIEELDWA